MSVIDLFEKDLINKINYKASSKISNDAVLFKSFKFFDLTNQGFVSRSEFYRVIAKIGVVISSPQDMKTIFEYYDKNKQQRIYYQNFIQEILFKQPQIQNAQTNRPRTSKEQKNQQIIKPQQKKIQQKKQIITFKSSEDVINHIRANLKKEKMDSLLKLAISLKDLDINRTHQLNQQKVNVALNNIGIQNVNKLFNKFELNSSGQINYAELIYDIRQNLSNQKNSLILSIFSRLDTSKQGEIPIQIVLQKYEAADKQIFERAIQLYCKFQGIDDGIFTDDDFADFFGFISFWFVDQNEFRLYISSAFPDEQKRSIKSNKSRRQFDKVSQKKQKETVQKILEEPQSGNFAKKQFNQSHIFENLKSQKAESIYSRKQFENAQIKSRVSKISSQNPTKQIQMILLRIKKRLASKGPKGFLLFEKALRTADLNRNSLVNFHQFKKIVRDQRIDVTDTQIKDIFDLFDQEDIGCINYPEFIFTIEGQVPEHRKKFILRVWEKVKQNEQYTTFLKLRYIFDPRTHPDVKNGRRYEEQIFKQMNQTILLVQDLNGVRTQQITKEDFIEYLQNMSYSTPDDQLFEFTLTNVWKLTSQNKIYDQYAGSRKVFDQKKNPYLSDHHRYLVQGGSVSQNAPFGTFNEPTNYRTESRRHQS